MAGWHQLRLVSFSRPLNQRKKSSIARVEFFSAIFPQGGRTLFFDSAAGKELSRRPRERSELPRPVHAAPDSICVHIVSFRFSSSTPLASACCNLNWPGHAMTNDLARTQQNEFRFGSVQCQRTKTCAACIESPRSGRPRKSASILRQRHGSNSERSLLKCSVVSYRYTDAFVDRFQIG